MLTDQELRQALMALSVIEERGDDDELAAIAREVTAAQFTTPPNSTAGSLLARRLSGFLDISRERCEAAAEDVWGNGRQRALFRRIIERAIELIGPCRELTGEATFTPYTEPQAAQARPTAPAAVPSVRIVAEQGAVV